MTLSVLSRREAEIWEAVVDGLLEPAPDLPPAGCTTAAHNLDAWLAAAPALNRAGVRLLLHGLEAAPRLLGHGARLTRLDDGARAAAAGRLHTARRPPLPGLRDLLRTLAATTYYGDEDVLRRLGHDPQAAVARGRALRAAEGRP